MTFTQVLFAIAALEITLISAALPEDYQTKSALEKQALLWQEIIREPYPAGQYPSGGFTAPQKDVLKDPHHHTYTFMKVGDELQTGRLKLFHTFGACAKANLVIFPNSTYTGIFKAASVNTAIVRPSVAALDPKRMLPSMALKVLIDGKPSQNIVTSLDDTTDSYNYMTHVVSNIFKMEHDPLSGVYGPEQVAMAQSLALLPGGPLDRPVKNNNMPVYETAAMEGDGSVVPTGHVIAPYKVDFVPNPVFGAVPDQGDDFRVQLQRISAGSVMYNVVLYRSEAAWDSELPGDLVGQVVLTSGISATKHCDERLFMQHARKAHQDS